MRFLTSVFAAFLLLLAFTVARAGVIGGDKGESYANPSYKELTQTLVMMDGVDITDPLVANDYAKLLYCDLWKQNSKNDFDWQKIRQQIVTRITQHKEYYRIQYQLGGTVFLNVYNFETQDFPFKPDSALVRVGSMSLLDVSQIGEKDKGIKKLCGDDEYSLTFPINHTVQMHQPLTFDRLKIPMDEAKQLLDKMAAMRNTDRRLYVRFRFRLQSLLAKMPPPPVNLRRNRAMFQAELSQIDVFLDKEMTKFVTTVYIR
ncbi:MAG TPA: DUF4852 domain-containing protein [Patescibacteria group bacterium]|nr:DUF4852 domain-containing protein [Patescibacteria group bacterium]